MTRYQFTPQAEADLFAIWAYIYKENTEAADRVEAAVREACEFLASTPMAGHTRKNLTSRPVRFWTVPRFPNYLIVYDPASQPLTVVRIFHAARDLAQQLGLIATSAP